MGLDSFTLTNVAFSNGKLTATVNYAVSIGPFDSLSTTFIRIFYYDNSTTRTINASVSSTSGSFPITLLTSGPYLTVSAQQVAITTLTGNVLSAGTYYPTVINTAPSPPSLSSGTYNPPQPDGSNFYLTTTTSVGTATISITVKKPGDSSFGFFLDRIPLSPNGIIPFKLPFSANPTLYGTYSFQAQAFDSSGNGSQLSNIATITINAPVTTNYTISDFRVTNQNGNTVTFAWSKPSGTIGSNGYQIRTNVNGVLTIPWSPSPTDTSKTLNLTYPAGAYEFWINPFNASNVIQTDSNHVFISLTSPVTGSVAVTIKAVDGTQQTFYLSQADSTGVSASPPAAIISSIASNNPVSNTLQDVANFFQAHNQSTTPPPQPTPPPVISTPQVSGNNVTIVYSSTGTAILITRNGVPISSTATLTTGTLVDQGLNPGTYQYTFVASKVGVQSTPVSVTATVSTPPPAQTNYAYNIQIPNVSNALRLVTATNYGTTSSISFPARAFVNTILNQDVATIPNTLNALFITNVGDTPNEVQVANALIGYFPNTPPPPTGPKRSILEIAGGIFAGLLTLSLITGGSLKKGKR